MPFREDNQNGVHHGFRHEFGTPPSGALAVANLNPINREPLGPGFDVEVLNTDYPAPPDFIVDNAVAVEHFEDLIHRFAPQDLVFQHQIKLLAQAAKVWADMQFAQEQVDEQGMVINGKLNIYVAIVDRFYKRYLSLISWSGIGRIQKEEGLFNRGKRASALAAADAEVSEDQGGDLLADPSRQDVNLQSRRRRAMAQ